MPQVIGTVVMLIMIPIIKHLHVPVVVVSTVTATVDDNDNEQNNIVSSKSSNQKEHQQNVRSTEGTATKSTLPLRSSCSSSSPSAYLSLSNNNIIQARGNS